MSHYICYFSYSLGLLLLYVGNADSIWFLQESAKLFNFRRGPSKLQPMSAAPLNDDSKMGRHPDVFLTQRANDWEAIKDQQTF